MQKEMTISEFIEYASEQVKACDTEDEKWKKPRMKALGEAFNIAKQAFFDNGASSVKFEVYEDPAQQKIEETTIDPTKAAAEAESGSLGRTIFRKMDEDDTEVWPSDLNTKEFLEDRGEVRKGEWGLDSERL